MNSERMWIAVVSVAISLLLLHCEGQSYKTSPFNGITGNFCASLPDNQTCCFIRHDYCSAKILDTVCYCDEQCHLHRETQDCCPDYFSHFKGDWRPGSINTLGKGTFEGTEYNNDKAFKMYCNKCHYVPENDGKRLLCDQNQCLMNESFTQRVGYEISTWNVTKYSKFLNLTLEEGIKNKLGTDKPSNFHLIPLFIRKNNLHDLPKNFDSRENWPCYISPVQDQGSCGASWAISLVDVASDRFAIMSKGREKIQLSAQHLVNCNRHGQLGCKGGDVVRAWKFMAKYGLVDKNCCDWHGKEEECKVPLNSTLLEAKCSPRNSIVFWDELYKLDSVYRLDNETQIMYDIMNNGPVQATMQVFRDFFNYKSGIYVHTELLENYPTGYHAVRIVGWGEETSPLTNSLVKFWHVANSWGREWGEDGYFRILRGENECHIEQYVLAAWPQSHI